MRLLVLLSLAASAIAGGDLGRGFGGAYDWHQLQPGLSAAKEAGKPAMIV